MNITPEWILAFCAVGTFAGLIIGALWKFSKNNSLAFSKLSVAIERHGEITKQIINQQKYHTENIKEHDIKLQKHENQLIKLETWKDYHEEAHDK